MVYQHYAFRARFEQVRARNIAYEFSFIVYHRHRAQTRQRWLNLAHQILRVTEAEVTIHNMLCIYTQIDEADCSECMMACADHHDSLFARCVQYAIRDQEISCDHQRRRSSLNGLQLRVLTIPYHNQTTRLDVLGHRICFHRADEDAIP